MTEIIEAYQRPLPETRTPNKSCKWEVTCEHRGKTHIAVSRAGATHELARTLINAGAPPGAVLVVRTEGRAGTLTTTPIGEWALWTYGSGGDKRIPWERAQASLARFRERHGA